MSNAILKPTPADIVRAHKSDVYATMDSVDAVIKRYNITGTDLVVLGIAINTTIEIIAKALEGAGGDDNAHDPSHTS